MLPFLIVAIIMLIAVAIPIFNSKDYVESTLPEVVGSAYRIIDYRTGRVVNYITEKEIKLIPNKYDKEYLYNFTIKCSIKLKPTEYLEFPIKENITAFHVLVDDRPMIIDYISNNYYNIHLTRFGDVTIKELF